MNDFIIYYSELPDNISGIYFYAFRNKCISINNKIKKEQQDKIIRKLIEKRKENPKAKLLVV